jgi:hypothetical protein
MYERGTLVLPSIKIFSNGIQIDTRQQTYQVRLSQHDPLKVPASYGVVNTPQARGFVIKLEDALQSIGDDMAAR